MLVSLHKVTARDTREPCDTPRVKRIFRVAVIGRNVTRRDVMT